MALSRPLFVGFSSASKVAREGGDLEVTVQTARGPVTFTLPWFFVRDVDALLERWRREEHEATLLTMNDGVLGATLVQAAWAGGLHDTTFLISRVDAVAGHLHIALRRASEGGHTVVVALLLDRGVDIHYDSDWAFRMAAFRGHLETTRFLLARGVDVNTMHGVALRQARFDRREEVIALLLEHGAVDHQ